MQTDRNDIHLSPLDIPPGSRHQQFGQQQPQQQQILDQQQEHLKTIHPYYSSLPHSLGSRFKDLDLDAVYTEADEALLNPDTQNLIVDFGKDGAFVAKDVGFAPEDDLDKLIGPVTGSGSRPRDLRTRWICIFTPHLQHDLIEIIGNRYGLSPRHKTMLLSKPPHVPCNAPSTYSTSRLRRAGEKIKGGMERARRSMESRINMPGLTGTITPEPDAAGSKAPDTATPTAASSGFPAQAPQAQNGNTGFMELVAKVWHWHAVEWGGRFLCIGYNSLYNIPATGQGTSNVVTDDKGFPAADGSSGFSTTQRNHYGFAFDLPGSKESSIGGEDNQTGPGTRNSYPEGRRLWTWLILCDDGTVISLHEPHQFRTTPTALDYRSQIAIVRKNLRTVFRSLSRAPCAIQSNEIERAKGGIGTLEELPFRKRVSGVEILDSGPSLLFYYLFDNWYSSWSLAIDRQHPYARRLRWLRNELIRDPKLQHVDDLLHLAGQLAVLKRMYETYNLIIDRILYRQENSLSMAKGGGKVISIGNDNNYDSNASPTITSQDARTRVTSPALAPSSPSPSSFVTPHAATEARHPPRTDTAQSNQIGDPTILGVPLSPLAVTRFERMRDRIKMYALAEIQDCLDEKDGLVSMTFNLIAFRQTDAVEKLSRVAILLAKATILFLPITLITGFFSMQIRDMGNYTQKDFWIAAGVVMAVTLGVLFTVGRYTDTAETMRAWMAVRTVWFGWVGGRKKEKRG